MTHTLYLVSAEDNGVQYWKVGVTKHKDPLRRDPKRYKEVFRSVQFEDELWTAESIAYAAKNQFGWLEDGTVPGDVEESAQECAWFVEQQIARCFQVIGCPVGKESIDCRVSLSTVLTLFDQYVSWYKSGDICYAKPHMTAQEQEAFIREVVCIDCYGDQEPEKAEKWISHEKVVWERMDELMAQVRSELSEVEIETKEPQPMW